ncbi:stress response NST1-like protein [Actinidia rufa]|uniref:Stress response NST1-like protein n=1 Tax=Actinidia rufa TaxID=165716 RepID=A0A7J0E0T1_9ERIC|nr:stress response NST1-like protein [Actinidia rufa]
MAVIIPYLCAPISPRSFGEYYFSAPPSPRHVSEFYLDFDDFAVTSNAISVPFDWEEKPGTPKSPNTNTSFGDDFAFDVSEELGKKTIPAEELFDGGKIRPFRPPPRSPRKKKEIDTFATEVENTRERTKNDRGRERVSSLSSSNSGRRGARSLSPHRVSKYPWEEEQQLQQKTEKKSPTSSKPALSSTTSKGSKKWSLKDFFLFRSASEGRAADRDPLKKYIALLKRREEVKSSSVRSIEGSNSGSNSKRRGPISAHELHYTVNRAVSEDLKKKTFLPYKQGILGRLAFNPAVHALANGFGLSRN